MKFEVFLNHIDSAMIRKFGVTSACVEDYDWYAMYDDGFSIDEAVKRWERDCYGNP